MTQLSLNLTPPTFNLSIADKANRLIAENRALTPPSATDRRVVPRLSIAEMNAMTIDDLRDNYNRLRRDERGPVTKFLDLVDLPRNAAANLIFGDIARKRAREGETGTFGLGKVYFSDALKEMGVKSGLVRGVVGFVGDVLMDPLTYLGGTGAGLRVVLQGGGRAIVGRSGAKVLRAATSAAGKGEAVRDPLARGVLAAAVGGERRLDALSAVARTGDAARAQKVREIISRRVYGDARQAPSGLAGASSVAGRTVARTVGFDEGAKGGILARTIGRPTEFTTAAGTQATSLRLKGQREAVDAFSRRYGKGAAPGVHFGRDASGRIRVVFGGRESAVGRGVVTGSTVAHIPFTEWGIHVGGFTPDAKAARRTVNLALGGVGIGSASANTQRINEALATLNEIRRTVDEGIAAEDVFEAAAAPLRAQAQDAANPTRYAAQKDLDRLTEDHLLARQQRHENLRGVKDSPEADAVGGLLNRLRDITNTVETATVDDIGDVMALRRVIDEAQALSKHYSTLQDAAETGVKGMAQGYELATAQARNFNRGLDALLKVEKDIGRPLFDAQPVFPTARTINASPAVQNEVLQRVASERLLERFEEAQQAVDAFEGAVNPERMAAIANMNAIRDEIHSVTAPLREGLQQPIEDAVKAVKARVSDSIEGFSSGLLEVAERDVPRAHAIADSLSVAAEASLEYANAVRGSAIQLAQSHPLGAALEVTKNFLNTTDDLVAVSVIAPLVAAAKRISGREDGVLAAVAEATDNALKSVFGTRGGKINRVVNAFKYDVYTKAKQRVKTELLNQIKALSDIANAYHIPNTKIPELSSLVMARAHKLAEQRAGKQLFHSTRLDGTPDPMVELLQEAANSGWLNEQLFPGLGKKIDELAAKNIDFMQALASAEKADKILGTEVAQHVPRTLTPQAELLVRRTLSEDLARGKRQLDEARAKALGEVLEQFQNQRTLIEYRFDSQRLGKPVSFMEGDRWILSMSPAEIAEAVPDPDKRRFYDELRTIINEYDSMPDRLQGYLLSPWAVNERAGELSMLTGRGDGVPGGFLDTSMAHAIASRVGQHERAVARRSFKTILEIPGMAIVNTRMIQQLRNSPVGTEVPLGNGAIGKIVRMGRRNADDPGQFGVQIGDDTFRPLAKDVRDKIDNPIIDMIGKEGRGALYHDNAARILEGIARIYDSVDDAKQLLQLYDTFNANWKAITLFHPSWTILNVLGDTMNLVAGGASMPDMIRNIAPAIKMARFMRDDEKLAGITFNIGGQKVDALKMRSALQEARVLDANLFAETTVQLLTRGHRIMPSASGVGLYAPSSIASDFRQGMAARAASAYGARGKLADMLGATKDVMSDRYIRTLISPWMTANQRVSDAIRTMGYMAFRSQGLDHEEATRRVIRSVFDYGDATHIEAAGLKRMFPFYSWIRNNTAYQLKLLLDKPMYLGSVPLLQNAIEEAIAGDQRVPLHMRPQWMREQLAIQVGKDPEDRMALMLGSALPQEGVVALGQALGGADGVQEFLNYFASSLNVPTRVALEWAMGREMFSDRTIGGDKALADVTLTQSLANQLRPAREIPKILSVAGESGVGAAAVRSIAGGRAQPFTEERLHVYRARQFRDEEAKLRTAIRRAEFQDDAEGSIRTRARLMRLYETMVRDGFEEDVPKWAKDQLSTLAASDSP